MSFETTAIVVLCLVCFNNDFDSKHAEILKITHSGRSFSFSHFDLNLIEVIVSGLTRLQHVQTIHARNLLLFFRHFVSLPILDTMKNKRMQGSATLVRKQDGNSFTTVLNEVTDASALRRTLF